MNIRVNILSAKVLIILAKYIIQYTKTNDEKISNFHFETTATLYSRANIRRQVLFLVWVKM